MPLHLHSLRCPHCGHQPSKEEQTDTQWRQTLLAREPVNCPKCGLPSQLPELAEKLISVGLLASCIIAPALAFWASAQLAAIIIFGLGIGLLILGAAKQQLKATEQTDQSSKLQDPPSQTDSNPSEPTHCPKQRGDE